MHCMPESRVWYPALPKTLAKVNSILIKQGKIFSKIKNRPWFQRTEWLMLQTYNSLALTWNPQYSPDLGLWQESGANRMENWQLLMSTNAHSQSIDLLDSIWWKQIFPPCPESRRNCLPTLIMRSYKDPSRNVWHKAGTHWIFMKGMNK